MGNFYANVAVREAGPQAVRTALAEGGYRAYITPPLQGHVVVYEERSDEGDLDRLQELGRFLSERLATTALAALNHDDEALALCLFHRGRSATTYVSARGLLYGMPLTVNALLPLPAAWSLCWRYGRLVHLSWAWYLLQRPQLFQVTRHAELARLLGLPAEAVVLGHRYVERGELPGALRREDLLRS